jgi:phospholipid/cholesterol/gamma-HCH transport system substrate-binding protein
MRRIVLICSGLLAGAMLIAFPALGSNGSSGDYKVRGIFDNGSFMVSGEEVRVAGAKVGTVDSVDVSGDDEIVSREGGDHAVPGKAVIVMNITDAGFKDFRTDASCIVRPQSLIGERYVDCTPTQPRAAGQQPPPELPTIPDDQPGSGEHLLPLENNGTTVDLDLVQNIQRLPFRDRLRLILNDLGAGLAGRGEDLGEVIDRANPALRQTDRVLNILAQQSRQLASLASNGDAVLGPLARNRTHITGFFRNAAIAGQATAERGADLEAALSKFPATLREVHLTMNRLKQFADQGTPLFADLRTSGRYISRATQKLTPFARAGIPALTTLGDAAQSAGPKLAASDPVLTDLAATASAAVPVGNNLSALLDTFVRTKGFEALANFVYDTSNSVNGFDALGHYLRVNAQVTNCNDVSAIVLQGCEAFFRDTGQGQSQKKKKKKGKKSALKAAIAPSQPSASQPVAPLPQIDVPELDQLLPQLTQPDEHAPPPGNPGDQQQGGEKQARAGTDQVSARSTSLLLDFLLGSGA